MDTVGTATNGRDGGGRFAAGNRAASGHKRREHIARLRNAFTNCLTQDDIVCIVEKLLELSKAGDVQAIRLLLDRAIGKPETVDAEHDQLTLAERRESLLRELAEFNELRSRADDSAE